MKHAPIVIGGTLVVLVVGVVAGLAMGLVKIDAPHLFSSFTSNGDAVTRTLVLDIRLPRVAAALVTGACLGLAGCLLQSATKNPLGDPQLFGLGGGAAIVQALGMGGIIRTGPWGLFSLSVAASILGAVVVAFFASRKGLSPARLALMSVSLSALAAALTTGILAGTRVFSSQSISFVGGSLANRTWDDVLPAIPFIGLGIVLSLVAAGNLNMLALGDQVAANMGAKPSRTRVTAILASGILGGTAVAVAGLVGFVGLMVPHLARLLVGHDVRGGVVASLLVGAAVMLYADQAARLVFMPHEVPAGLITALAGAPIMMYVARYSRWS